MRPSAKAAQCPFHGRELALHHLRATPAARGSEESSDGPNFKQLLRIRLREHDAESATHQSGRASVRPWRFVTISLRDKHCPTVWSGAAALSETTLRLDAVASRRARLGRTRARPQGLTHSRLLAPTRQSSCEGPLAVQGLDLSLMRQPKRACNTSVKLTPICLLALLSCGNGGSERPTVTEDREHRGPLCVATAADGNTISVRAWSGYCLSSSCDTVVESGCQITRDGSRLVVEGRATVRSESGACTTDCGMFANECQLADVAPGTYDVVLGNGSEKVVLPTPGVALFLGDSLDLCALDP